MGGEIVKTGKVIADDTEITKEEDEKFIRYKLTGENLNDLIGHHGECLYALSSFISAVCKNDKHKKVVLDGLDLDIRKGESLVVIGGSGTGKSVLIKCIQGLLQPDAGSILIDEQEVVGLKESEKEEMHSKMGMLFQGGALFDSLSVWENVAFGLLENQKMNKKQAKNEAIRVLRQVGLAPDVADLSPSELSGGMQKRVGLARAIATRPEIIFFDEPTTGLDPIMADVINDLIIESVKGLGATALTITHDMASARKIADRIAMLYKGKIIWQGTVKEMDKTTDPYVCQFINGCSQGPIKVEV